MEQIAIRRCPVYLKKEKNSIDEIIGEYFRTEDAVILYTTIEKVDFGYFDGSVIHLPPGVSFDLTELMDARIFRSEKELHLFRSGGELKGRILEHPVESEGTMDVYTKDEIHYLWGRNGDAPVPVGFTSVTTDRGITYHLPLHHNGGKYRIRYFFQETDEGLLKNIDLCWMEIVGKEVDDNAEK